MFLCNVPPYGRIWLIDTPGFSDTRRSDAQVLEELANWLRAAYLQEIKLTGIIYLHSMQERRQGRSSMAALSLFRDLTGQNALHRVFLVTTFWDRINRPDQRQVAENSELELHQTERYWGRFISDGAHTDRHDHSRESAHRLIRSVIEAQIPGDPGGYVRLQTELEEGTRLENTGVGRNIAQALREQAVAWEREIAELRQLLEDALQRQTQENREELALREAQHQRRREQMQRDQELLRADITTIDRRFQRLEAADRAHQAAQRAQQEAETRRLRQEIADEEAETQRIQVSSARRQRAQQNRQRLRQLEQDLWYPRCLPM